MRKMIEKFEIRTKRNYHVWCCECRDKTMRPLGKPIKDGCGQWSVYASKHRYDEVPLLPKCEFCNRKKRLNKKTSKVYRFDTRIDAIRHQEAMNTLRREN